MWAHSLFLAALFFISMEVIEVDCNQKYAKKLLLISMDGFRWDYLQKAGAANTPNFNKLAREGVKLPYMYNAFITKTFPNHYTIATGLYEESHGIIGNKMYDPDHDAYFTMASKESFWWEEGEPIWVTARKQYLKTATYYWAGSETAIHGVRPDIYLAYSDYTPYQQRIDTVMDWFVNKSVDFAALYFPEPDKTGHLVGPDSPLIISKTIEMDHWLGKILEGIKANGLDDKLNMILLSDHGMANIDMNNRLISLLDYVKPSQLIGVYDKGSIANIRPLPGQIQAVYDALKNAHPNMTVYKKEDIPEHFHYKHNKRVQPIFVMADEGWMIVELMTPRWKELVELAELVPVRGITSYGLEEIEIQMVLWENSRSVACYNRSTVKDDDMKELGAHGYDNTLPSMRPIFFARGPNFKKNYQGQPIHNVDVYPLMCELLVIAPARNNGSLAATDDFRVPLSTWDGSNGGTKAIHTNIACLVTAIVFVIMNFCLPG